MCLGWNGDARSGKIPRIVRIDSDFNKFGGIEQSYKSETYQLFHLMSPFKIGFSVSCTFMLRDARGLPNGTVTAAMTVSRHILTSHSEFMYDKF